MTYEIKDTTLLGKVLAKNGKTVLANINEANELANRFNGTLIKAMPGRYNIKLSETANSIEECDCGCDDKPSMAFSEPGIQSNTYNQYPDHEVQMARQQLYRTAKLSIMLHDILKNVRENQGLEGWVQSKLTRAADYIETVYAYLDYEMRNPSEMHEEEVTLQQPQIPGQNPQQNPNADAKPGMSSNQPAKVMPKTPGMVKMAKIDTNGNVQGQPIMVPAASIKSKQQAGFHVIGESASTGVSSAGSLASSMGAGNGFLNGGPGAIKRRGKKKKSYTAEGKAEVNFTADDIKRMEGMRDIMKMKQYAKQLIITPSEKPIKPQKVAWFNHVIDSKKDPMQLIKFMYDMLLGGEGKAVLGTRYSTEPSNYRKVFNDVTTEDWETLEPGKRFGLANPRILTVGDDPQGIYDFAVTGKNVLSINPFDANQWSNHQLHARNKGYMLKYTGTDPAKAKIAHAGETPRTGYNMAGEKLPEGLKDPKDNPCWKGYHPVGTKKKSGRTVPNCVPNESVEEANKGLYANVHAKRERIKHGSGEHMRKPGTKGAPTAQSWKDAAKTAKTDESETGPEFTGYWKGTDKGKPGKKMVGSN